MVTFPNIPTELVLRILSFAAYSSRQSAHAICLTSTWTLPIAFPVLYQTVAIKSKEVQVKFIAALTDARPKEIISDVSLTNDLSEARERGNSLSTNNKGVYVKCMLAPFATKEELKQCMTSCPNIEDLAIRDSQFLHLMQMIVGQHALSTQWNDGRKNNDFDLKFAVHLKKVTVVDNARLAVWRMMSLTGPPTLLQFFSNLTHLVLISTGGDHAHVTPLPLLTFPNLTHIAIPFNVRHSKTVATEYLDRAKELLRGEAVNLKMLILHVSGLDVAAARRRQDWRSMPFVKSLIVDANRKDERIYILPLNRFESYVYEVWERGARGGRSIWDEAVAVLQEAKTMRDITVRRLSIG